MREATEEKTFLLSVFGIQHTQVDTSGYCSAKGSLGLNHASYVIQNELQTMSLKNRDLIRVCECVYVCVLPFFLYCCLHEWSIFSHRFKMW